MNDVVAEKIKTFTRKTRRLFDEKQARSNHLCW